MNTPLKHGDAAIAVTRDDAQLLRALASLASVQPEERRAAHLVPGAEEMARRIEKELRAGGVA